MEFKIRSFDYIVESPRGDYINESLPGSINVVDNYIELSQVDPWDEYYGQTVRVSLTQLEELISFLQLVQKDMQSEKG